MTKYGIFAVYKYLYKYIVYKHIINNQLNPRRPTNIQNPTPYRLGFFYPKHRCWCGFRPLPLAHGPPEVVTPNALSAVFSLFSLLPLEHSRPEVAYRRGFAGHRFVTWLAGAGATETAKGTKKTARRRCVGAVRRSARTCQRHLVRAHNRTQED